VRGFSEALLVDLRVNAPHVKVAVVMPGHIGTSIVVNTNKVLGKPSALEMSAKDVARVRIQIQRRYPGASLDDDQIRELLQQMTIGFEQNAPVTAAQAASVILDGVRNDKWRILVGDDAYAIDRLIREMPENAYEKSFIEALHQQGHLRFTD
jgi:hypothetical protein